MTRYPIPTLRSHNLELFSLFEPEATAPTGRDLFSFHALCGRLFANISPAGGQLLGGLIQWLPPGMMNVAALIITLNALRLAEAGVDAGLVPPPGAKVYEAKWTGR